MRTRKVPKRQLTQIDSLTDIYNDNSGGLFRKPYNTDETELFDYRE